MGWIDRKSHRIIDLLIVTPLAGLFAVIMSGVVLFARPAAPQISHEVLDSISTPNEVETSIGMLKFIDSAPLLEIAVFAAQALDRSDVASGRG